MKSKNLKKIKLFILSIITVIMVACSFAGTYECEKGTVIIKDDNTWTATLYNTNAFGERYTNRLEGK